MEVMNILDQLPVKADNEIITELLTHSGVRIERIVSTGQSTSADAPYIQPHDEWILLLSGRAGLKVETNEEYRLCPGDCLLIPANRRHWVTWTAENEPTVWLAIHFPPIPNA